MQLFEVQTFLDPKCSVSHQFKIRSDLYAACFTFSWINNILSYSGLLTNRSAWNYLFIEGFHFNNSQDIRDILQTHAVITAEVIFITQSCAKKENEISRQKAETMFYEAAQSNQINNKCDVWNNFSLRTACCSLDDKIPQVVVYECGLTTPRVFFLYSPLVITFRACFETCS